MGNSQSDNKQANNNSDTNYLQQNQATTQDNQSSDFGFFREQYNRLGNALVRVDSSSQQSSFKEQPHPQHQHHLLQQQLKQSQNLINHQSQTSNKQNPTLKTQQLQQQQKINNKNLLQMHSKNNNNSNVKAPQDMGKGNTRNGLGQSNQMNKTTQLINTNASQAKSQLGNGANLNNNSNGINQAQNQNRTTNAKSCGPATDNTDKKSQQTISINYQSAATPIKNSANPNFYEDTYGSGFAYGNHEECQESYQLSSQMPIHTQDNQLGTLKKSIRVYVDKDIEFNVDIYNDQLTCGWLLSEVTRRYSEELNRIKKEREKHHALFQQQLQQQNVHLLAPSANQIQQQQQQIKQLQNKSSQQQNLSPSNGNSKQEGNGGTGEQPHSPQHKFTRKLIVALKTTDQRESLDYWLTQYDRPLEVLDDGEFLIAHFAKLVANRNREVCKKDFEQIKVIGRGGFSRVILVRKKDTGRLYAMKIMKKNKIIREKKLKPILSERKILEKLNHPFIIKLHWAFQSNEELFFVMDLCTGGEVFFHLNRLRKFSEEQAKFYFSEILLGIEYLHSKNVVYRDIKPENILVDVDGHIRVADFGLSKVIPKRTKSYSFCGSPEYMSPEMLQGAGHDRKVDIYCLGALLFEMLTGLPPFYNKDTNKMYESILNHDMHFPEYLPSSVVNLITNMLQRDPNKRYQSVSEIKRHSWMKDIKWDDLLAKRIQPPIIPNVKECHIDPDYVELPLDFEEQQYKVRLSTERRYSYYYESTLQSKSVTEQSFYNHFFEKNESGSGVVNLLGGGSSVKSGIFNGSTNPYGNSVQSEQSQQSQDSNNQNALAARQNKNVITGLENFTFIDVPSEELEILKQLQKHEKQQEEKKKKRLSNVGIVTTQLQNQNGNPNSQSPMSKNLSMINLNSVSQSAEKNQKLFNQPTQQLSSNQGSSTLNGGNAIMMSGNEIEESKSRFSYPPAHVNDDSNRGGGFTLSNKSGVTFEESNQSIAQELRINESIATTFGPNGQVLGTNITQGMGGSVIFNFKQTSLLMSGGNNLPTNNRLTIQEEEDDDDLQSLSGGGSAAILQLQNLQKNGNVISQKQEQKAINQIHVQQQDQLRNKVENFSFKMQTQEGVTELSQLGRLQEFKTSNNSKQITPMKGVNEQLLVKQSTTGKKDFKSAQQNQTSGVVSKQNSTSSYNVYQAYHGAIAAGGVGGAHSSSTGTQSSQYHGGNNHHHNQAHLELTTSQYTATNFEETPRISIGTKTVSVGAAITVAPNNNNNNVTQSFGRSGSQAQNNLTSQVSIQSQLSNVNNYTQQQQQNPPPFISQKSQQPTHNLKMSTQPCKTFETASDQFSQADYQHLVTSFSPKQQYGGIKDNEFAVSKSVQRKNTDDKASASKRERTGSLKKKSSQQLQNIAKTAHKQKPSPKPSDINTYQEISFSRVPSLGANQWSNQNTDRPNTSQQQKIVNNNQQTQNHNQTGTSQRLISHKHKPSYSLSPSNIQMMAQSNLNNNQLQIDISDATSNTNTNKTNIAQISSQISNFNPSSNNQSNNNQISQMQKQPNLIQSQISNTTNTATKTAYNVHQSNASLQGQSKTSPQGLKRLGIFDQKSQSTKSQVQQVSLKNQGISQTAKKSTVQSKTQISGNLTTLASAGQGSNSTVTQSSNSKMQQHQNQNAGIKSFLKAANPLIQQQQQQQNSQNAKNLGQGMKTTTEDQIQSNQETLSSHEASQTTSQHQYQLHQNTEQLQPQQLIHSTSKKTSVNQQRSQKFRSMDMTQNLLKKSMQAKNGPAHKNNIAWKQHLLQIQTQQSPVKEQNSYLQLNNQLNNLQTPSQSNKGLIQNKNNDYQVNNHSSVITATLSMAHKLSDIERRPSQLDREEDDNSEQEHQMLDEEEDLESVEDAKMEEGIDDFEENSSQHTKQFTSNNKFNIDYEEEQSSLKKQFKGAKKGSVTNSYMSGVKNIQELTLSSSETINGLDYKSQNTTTANNNPKLSDNIVTEEQIQQQLRNGQGILSQASPNGQFQGHQFKTMQNKRPANLKMNTDHTPERRESNLSIDQLSGNQSQQPPSSGKSKPQSSLTINSNQKRQSEGSQKSSTRTIYNNNTQISTASAQQQQPTSGSINSNTHKMNENTQNTLLQSSFTHAYPQQQLNLQSSQQHQHALSSINQTSIAINRGMIGVQDRPTHQSASKTQNIQGISNSIFSTPKGSKVPSGTANLTIAASNFNTPGQSSMLINNLQSHVNTQRMSNQTSSAAKNLNNNHLFSSSLSISSNHNNHNPNNNNHQPHSSASKFIVNQSATHHSVNLAGNSTGVHNSSTIKTFGGISRNDTNQKKSNTTQAVIGTATSSKFKK